MRTRSTGTTSRYRVVVEVECVEDELSYGALGKARCTAEAALALVKNLVASSEFAKPRGVRVRVVGVR